MSANKVGNARAHRVRHRNRWGLNGDTRRLRQLDKHTELTIAEMNAILGVANVSRSDVLFSIRNNETLNPVGPRDIRAEYQRGVTTVAGVEALGIPII